MGLKKLSMSKNEMIEAKKELFLQKRDFLLGRKANSPLILTSELVYTPYEDSE